MTSKENIQKLLDSYMAAETTREEEKLLSDFFIYHKDIPAEWQKYSIMFRGLRQIEPVTQVSHKMTMLKWSAVAAVVVLVIGTGLFFVHEEKREEPTQILTSIPNKPSPHFNEPLPHEPITETLEQNKQVSLSSTRKRRIRKSVKPQICAEEHVEVNKTTIRLSTRSLSRHRDLMRQNIQATFENTSVFTSQNPVEL